METKEAEAKEIGAEVSEMMSLEERVAASDKLIKKYALGAMGVGLIPLPLVDMIALTSLQLVLLSKLSKFYGIGFSKEKAKTLMGALLGSALPLASAGSIASIIKIIPIIGQTIGALTMPAVSGAATYAVGKVFVQHFESGGTFLDFDPAKVKEYFEEKFKEGKKIVPELKKAASTSTAK